MARNHKREEREGYWRNQGQNRDQEQQGRNWRGDEPYSRDYEMGGEEYRGENRQYNERGMRGGMGNMQEGRGQHWSNDRWGNENRDRGWDRGNQGWQGGRGAGWQGDRWQGGGFQGRGSENDWGMESPYGRSEWNQGMGGRWNPQERDRWSIQGQHVGRGPRSYKRQDNRIEEDINEQLTRHPMIDATEIEVSVQNGEVTLRGHVDHREAKRMAEDVAESVFGVKEVNNQIKVQSRGEGEDMKHETETSGKQRKAS